jgi:hypothetical protein
MIDLDPASPGTQLVQSHTSINNDTSVYFFARFFSRSLFASPELFALLALAFLLGFLAFCSYRLEW